MGTIVQYGFQRTNFESHRVVGAALKLIVHLFDLKHKA
jgi:hypothetical protein